MQIKLRVVPIKDTEGGRIFLYRPTADGLFEMGNVMYDSGSDREFLLKVLMDSHPYVSMIE
ncbi:MAG: hypothetical protein WC375_06750 [Methanomassiliicoccales archaeon]